MQFLRALPQTPHSPLPHLVFLNLVSANIAQILFEHRKVSQIYCIIYISDLLKDVIFFYYYCYFPHNFLFSLNIRSVLKNLFAILHEISDILHANLLQ